MGTEMGIALVLLTAFAWMAGTLVILSAIDRPERKARRQERRDTRAGEHRWRVEYRPVAAGSRPEGRRRHPRARKLRPH
ncbi:hypothetical protein Achl_1901 [Pseudarthrobacter chlorophenolicus A6]|uniref:Uncharacterized protein n=1 Tax=Pseudarthrobacter chlorophenolicus (strain ATCC 700700 / DSM 12829 / CIP 107037 / JCM 12360 / KCTC 9906 / NCIMB 13794 / A6) TaxID=452863 RepID=B8H8J8_PSECP|nr:hypothetical protein [Pseudarthrobacter chlorophenolicus]ACL39876.1 hypothetical protein Achl_1901 [Pseudarthrobacter chlorophenolicus A6]SDQ92096.1 hypothetical protein SAMN04489738_3602 [Pseudarthrobacter chlorophenolicus]